MTNLNTPTRLHVRSTGGWRMPENAVYVGPGSEWGNPFARRIPHGETMQSAEVKTVLVKQYRHWLIGGARPDVVVARYPLYTPEGREFVSITPITKRPDWREIRAELEGKDLACWCPENHPCHVDVLLEIANGGMA